MKWGQGGELPFLGQVILLWGHPLLQSDQKILTSYLAWRLQDDHSTAPVDKAGKMIVFMMSCCVGEKRF